MSNHVRSSSRFDGCAGGAAADCRFRAPGPAHAAPLLVEDFTNVAGLAASGWSLINNSSAGGSTSWFRR